MWVLLALARVERTHGINCVLVLLPTHLSKSRNFITFRVPIKSPFKLSSLGVRVHVPNTSVYYIYIYILACPLTILGTVWGNLPSYTIPRLTKPSHAQATIFSHEFMRFGPHRSSSSWARVVYYLCQSRFILPSLLPCDAVRTEMLRNITTRPRIIPTFRANGLIMAHSRQLNYYHLLNASLPSCGFKV